MKIKRRNLLILSIILLCVLSIGGKIYMNNKRFNDEMVNIVKSSQAKKIFEEGLKNLESKALTPDGVIKSYKINYESIEHNPMGGINGELIINDNEQLYETFILDADSEGKLIKNHGISSYSPELDTKLKGDK